MDELKSAMTQRLLGQEDQLGSKIKRMDGGAEEVQKKEKAIKKK